MADSDPVMIDADAHVMEPFDLWSSEAPVGREKDVPHYEPESDGVVGMYIGEERTLRTVSESDYHAGEQRTIVNDVRLRLGHMDAAGFWAQILYPGVAGLVLGRLLSIKDAALLDHCVRVYNDWVADWARPANGRLVPIALLPLQDVERSVAELERSVAIGHRGVLFPHRPQEMGLPLITDPAWDPIWRACSETGIPLTFHGGFGDDVDRTRFFNPDWRPMGHAAAESIGSIVAFLDNMDVLLTIMFSSILPRFPDLRIASAESGVGYVPFLLEAADWHFHATEMRNERPEFELLPSEYFKRQIYLTYWFEESGPANLLEVVGPDRLMFQTDFPHRTSLYGQSQIIGRPLSDILTEKTTCLAPHHRPNVLWANAVALFGLTPPPAGPAGPG